MEILVEHNEKEESLELWTKITDVTNKNIVAIIDLPWSEFERLINCWKKERNETIFRILWGK